MNKADAQRRADRIRGFREELAQLDRDGVVSLSPDQRAAVTVHHDALLAELVSAHDVDTTQAVRQLSWGMRMASFLGALALCAAVWFFFYRIWGGLSTSTQVALLAAAPLAALWLTHAAARRERTLYVATICAVIALACFVLNLSALGAIFNITPTQHALAIWSTFAFLLAYAYGMKLVLVGGILCLAGWLAATTGTWSGCYWLGFGERPENFLPAGVLLFALPSVIPHKSHHDFPVIYRIFGLLGIYLPLLILANWGATSYLLWPDDRVEPMYQTLAFVAAGLGIWIGIRRDWGHVVNTAATFFVIYLYTKFFDWWWDWMPKYLFFLLMGLLALGLLLALRRLRHLRMRTAT